MSTQSDRSLHTSITTDIDTWRERLKTGRMKDSLQATINLVSNFNSPIVCSYLIGQKMKEIEMSSFTTVLKSVMNAAEQSYKTLLIGNLERVMDERSILTTVDINRLQKQKILLTASIKIMEVKLSHAQKATKVKQSFEKLKKKDNTFQGGDDNLDEDIELMKFFQGIRRYQDDEQDLSRQAVDKLRVYKEGVIRNVQLIKGFKLCSMIKILEKSIRTNQKTIFILNFRSILISKFAKKLNKIVQGVKSDAMQRIKTVNSLRELKKIAQYMAYLSELKRLKNTVECFTKLASQIKNIKKAIFKAKYLVKERTRQCFSRILAYANARKTKMSQLTLRFIMGAKQHRSKIMRMALYRWRNTSGTSKKPLIKIIVKKIQDLIKESFVAIRTHNLETKGNQLSLKMKAKVLQAAVKPQKVIDIRKAFFCWYTRGNSKLIRQKMIDVAVYANISKFTVMARFRNLFVPRMSRKINIKSGLFSMMLAQKVGKFQGYVLKDKFNLWRTRVKQIRRLLKMTESFGRLQYFQDQLKTRHAYLCLCRNLQEAKIKKRFFIIMFRNSFNDAVKCFHRWKRIPDVKKTYRQSQLRRVVKHYLVRNRREQLNIIWNIFMKNYEICILKKVNLLTKAFAMDAHYTHKAFTQWITLIKGEKKFLKDSREMAARETMLMAIEHRKQQIRSIIDCFKSELRRKTTLRTYFSRVCNNVNSNMIVLLNKMRSLLLTNKEKQFKTILFERCLSNHVTYQLKATMEQFKICNIVAKSKKSALTAKFCENATKRVRNMYMSFSSNIGNLKRDKMSRSIVSSMTELNNIFKEKCLQNLFTDRKHRQIRVDAIRRLIQAQHNNVRSYLLAWKEETSFLRNSQQRLRFGFVQFFQTYQDNKWQGIRNIIKRKFKKALLIKKYLNLVSQNRILNIKSTVEKWKQLPKRINNVKIDNANRLFQELRRVEKVARSITFSAFKYHWTEGTFRKVRLFSLMYEKTTEIVKKKLALWRSVNQVRTQQLQCRVLISSFQAMSVSFRNNLVLLLDNPAEWVIKEKAFLKLKQGIHRWKSEAISLWRIHARDLTMNHKLTAQKRAELTKMLQDLITNSKQKALRECIALFKKNWRILLVQNNFFQKLMNTQFGKVIGALQIWKNLPVPKNKELIGKANKFQETLQRHVSNNLKATWRAFVSDYEQGLVKKKYIMRLLIQKCSKGLGKFFEEWKTQTRKDKLYGICTKTEKIIKNLNQLTIQNLRGMFNVGRRQLLKQKLSKIIRDDNEKTCFKQWLANLRQNKQNLKIRAINNVFDRLKQNINKNIIQVFQMSNDIKIKTKYAQLIVTNHLQMQKQAFKRIFVYTVQQKGLEIERLQNFFKNISSFSAHQLRYAIQKMNNNMQYQRRLSKIFTKIHLNATRNALVALDSFKKLPDRVEIRRKQILTQIVLKGVEMSNKLMRQHMDVFRNNLAQGNQLKKRAIYNLVSAMLKKAGRFYQFWNESMRATRTIRKCRQTEDFLHELTAIASVNIRLICQNPRQIFLKEKYLTKLFSAQSQLLHSFFNRWINNAKVIKINQDIDEHKKKIMIGYFEGLLKNNEAEGIRQCLKRFYENWKISMVQTNFLKKLMMTKGGRVAQAFRIWKELPEPNQLEKIRNANKFYFVLSKIASNWLRKCIKPILETNSEAEIKKKRAILRLLDVTSSGIRKYYSFWMNLNKRTKIFQICRSMDTFMSSLTNIAVSNINLLLQNQYQAKLKQKYIQKLIDNTEGLVRQRLHQWRETAKVIKMQAEMNEQKKNEARAILLEAIGDTKRLGIRNSIKSFYKNYRICQVGRNFFNRLLSTKAGKTVKAFETWKALPPKGQNERKAKAFKFSNVLTNLVVKNLRNTFNIYNQMRLIAQNKQKFCIKKLIKKCTSYEQRKYYHWKTLTHQMSLLDKARAIDSMLNTCFKKLSDNLKQLMIEPARSEVKTKQSICRRMISNSFIKLSYGFSRWVETYKNDNIRIEIHKGQLQQHLARFVLMFWKNRQDGLKEVIEKMRRNKVRNQSLIKYFEKVQQSREISLKTALTKWLRIGDGGKTQLMKQKIAMQFLKKMDNFVDSLMKVPIRAIQDQSTEYLILTKSKIIQSLFDHLNQNTQNVFSLLLRNPKNLSKISASLSKMCRSLNSKLKESMGIWRQFVKVKQLQIKKTQENRIISMQFAISFVQETKNIKTAEIIKLFYKNYKICEIQKRVLRKILQNKGGKTSRAFYEWKNLPDLTAEQIKKRMSVFERGLDQYVNSKIKLVFEQFKACIYRGDIRKKNVIRRLIHLTMSDSNKMFNKWRQLNNQHKILSKSDSIHHAFSILNTINTSTLRPLFQKSSVNLRKFFIKRLMLNNIEKLRHAFHLWRDWKTSLRNIIITTKFNKISQIISERRALQETMRILKNQRQINIVRNYINSLWRWKTSNIEAQYYTKFINIFKESEELLSFSRILNSKLYNIYNYAFRKVQSSITKPDFRASIMFKHLKKRLNSYFNLFRKNTKQTEVEYWQRQFQRSIKGISIIKAFEYRVRKYKCYIIKDWRNKAKNVTQKVRACKLLNKATNRILRKCLMRFTDGLQTKKVQKMLSLISSVYQYQMQVVFSNLSSTYKLAKLFENIEYAVNSITNEAFGQIIKQNHRKQIQGRALKNLSNALADKKKEKMRSVLRLFKRHSHKLTKVKIFTLLSRKFQDILTRTAFQKLKQMLRDKYTLKKYKGIHRIGEIDTKYSFRVLQSAFVRWRTTKKKENPWMRRSMLYFATKSSIGSSLAVSLWRLKYCSQ